MTRRLVQFACAVLLASAVCLAADPKPPAVIYIARLRNGFTMRFDHREVRGSSSRLFLDGQGASFVDVPTADIVSLDQEALPVAAPQPEPSRRADIPAAIAAASDRHGIDADLLYSVIRAESGFNAHAVSPKGAQGLMQLMPETAGKLGVADAFDTASNVDAGTRYLRELLERYHYDLVKALAAYNAGPARVDQYHGVPPYHETRAYVARIVREYNQAVLQRRREAHTSSVARTQPLPPDGR